MGRPGHWVMYTYEAGGIGEKLKFYVPDGKPGERMAKRVRSALKKYEQKIRFAQRRLARIINENFYAGDLLVGLDYSDAGLEKVIAMGREMGLAVDDPDHDIRRDAIWEAAAHEADNLLRRVKRELAKDGIELKYVVITSDQHPDTKEEVRVHHHLVVNKEAKEAFLKKWKKLGTVDYETFWSNQKDRTWIAEYFMNQVRRIPDAKKYRYSRNLRMPKPKKRECLTDAEIRLPKNCKLLCRGEYHPGQIMYMRYELPAKRKDKTGGGVDPDDPEDLAQ